MLDVSCESIELYKKLAYKHLHDNNIILKVCPVNEDKFNKLYGICLTINGEETVYDIPVSNISSPCNSQDEALLILEQKILPNLGYLVHKQSLINFHKFMA